MKYIFFKISVFFKLKKSYIGNNKSGKYKQNMNDILEIKKKFI